MTPGFRIRGPRALLLPVALWGAAGLSSCASGRELTLPSPASEPRRARHDGLHAGFGRADITPPPGVPMAGHGFEGRQAQGYRQRLYARALVLEDAEGERVALVVADLPHLSLLLHRLAAEAVRGRTGLGADRLIVSATHTHSGPGNSYGASQYNAQAGALPGFDLPLARFVAEGIAAAVEAAADSLREAVAAWGRREVSGVARNRSLEPHLANPGAGDPGPAEAVDDTLRMLRVDRCRPGWTDCRPRGALSVFAIHGTVLPPANALFDGDVHGVVEREVEAHIEASHPELGHHFRSRAFHLFANGAEGDVSPDLAPESRCGARRRLEGGRSIGGPRASEPAERWRWETGEPERCLRRAREEADRLGGRIAREAAALFDEIGGRAALGRADSLTRDVTVARAFRTVDLTRAPGLCAPLSGTAAFGGSEDARTRLFAWRLLGIDLGIREGGSAARDRPRGCHGRKRAALQPVQGWLTGDGGLPTHAQLAVVRVGEGLIAAVPGEATTMVGRAMRRAVERDGPRLTGPVALLGLANGYLQYITTEEEYALQHYEGGSTLYGPLLAGTLTAELARLASALRDGREVAEATEVTIRPGPRRSYLPAAAAGPDPGSIRRHVISLACSARGVSAGWIDLHPGRFRADLGQVLEVQRREGGEWRRVARDDSPRVLVRAIESRGDRGYVWSVEWETTAPPPGTYRLFLTPRLGMPAIPGSGEGRTVVCP